MNEDNENGRVRRLRASQKNIPGEKMQAMPNCGVFQDSPDDRQVSGDGPRRWTDRQLADHYRGRLAHATALLEGYLMLPRTAHSCHGLLDICAQEFIDNIYDGVQK